MTPASPVGFSDCFSGVLSHYPPAIRRQPLEQFRDDIGKTSALIGKPLSYWLA